MSQVSRQLRHKRVIVTARGGPEALQVIEEEVPEPKHGEVRIRVLATGVSLPDIMMREGIHPEKTTIPFTPGWDVIGVVDRLGDGVSGLDLSQTVAALPITGGYTEYICLPQHDVIPVPSGLDAAESVCLVFNYVTAYQMMHRSAHVRPRQRVLIHGASGGIGTALLQLGRVAGLEMYGTCSSQSASVVTDAGGIPIDYRNQDFVKEIHRLTPEGVEVVFDGIGGAYIWRSRKALRPGGKVVAYGFTSSLSGGRLASGWGSWFAIGHWNVTPGMMRIGLYDLAGWLLPSGRHVVPYSIQSLYRRKPELYREDLLILFDLLQQRKIKPIIAQRLPLTEARKAQELLGKGGVQGKIVLLCAS